MLTFPYNIIFLIRKKMLYSLFKDVSYDESMQWKRKKKYKNHFRGAESEKWFAQN